ncbi:LOB domain-containing protein 19-like [Durio zibethinus]|uniref:LOB domain-containing protein 19-like n=1 Tax=Durio zibethinus TaxID=66656 RepID=A0A6P6AZJ7_DURZI|nr:LOB domain-containing protein 19-like [Durio zibethinus]
MSANNGGGPCGACKFLRRKCVKGCIFAPYFDSDQGTADFAAVHKVFGASNASKMLQRIPAHKRVDAVVTLCYEALSRVRDPVYGCVGHIFTLQQQAEILQAELAYIQARLSALPRLPQMPPFQAQGQCPSPSSLHATSDIGSHLVSSSNMSMHFDPPQPQHPSIELTSFPNPFDQGMENKELQALAREFVSRYLHLPAKTSNCY